MTPHHRARAQFDRQLALRGIDAVLTRNILGPTVGGVATQIPTSVAVQVFATGYQPHELIAGSGIVSGDTKVLMSFSEIEAARWPGATPVHQVGDQRIPLVNDMITVYGRPMRVISVAVRPLDTGLVLQVRG